MPLDLLTFAKKLERTRAMFDESLTSVARATGIAVERLQLLEAAAVEPSGDEVLILADHYHIDFRFFISNESSLPVDRAEKLFRAHSRELSTADRLLIQEFLTLCENEAFLSRELSRPPPVGFVYKKRRNFYIEHGLDAARALRATFQYGIREVPDVFFDIRRLGFHVFRRRLENANISGLFINHDTAGPCILVNYNEDVYRQRFTAAHETAHALFDIENEFVVSFVKWDRGDLREIRANNFASAFLVPPEMLASLPKNGWTDERILNLAEQLNVNAAVLAIALKEAGTISEKEADGFMKLRMPRAGKSDPELPSSLSQRGLERKRALLERGISSNYAELCIEAFQRGVITQARLAEMLLVDPVELQEITVLFTGRLMP